MDADTRRAVLVFGVLLAVVAVPVGIVKLRDALRPRILEVRVVTASATDPVFRDGPRRLGPTEDVEIVTALRVHRPLRGEVWLAPVESLALGGRPVPHRRITEWPEDDRRLRVFWFTVESDRLGGELTAATAGERLAYRTFLAPELGNGLAARGRPEVHNDDYLGRPEEHLPVVGGTLRLYARVELLEEADDVQPLQAASSPGPEHILEPSYPALHRAASFPAPIRPEVGELFNLPGFQPAGDAPEERHAATQDVWGLSFAEAVRRRLVVSSASLAEVAAAGDPEPPEGTWRSQGDVTVWAEGLERDGRPLSWGAEVVTGDALVSDDRWLVLVGDDGDGTLGHGDRVIHCWRRPPALLPLEAALDPEALTVQHLRPTE